MRLTRKQVLSLKQAEAFLPFANPTFNNPEFQDASYRVLIVRLSSFRDVDRSIPHLFLFQEVRRALPRAFIDMAFFPTAETRTAFEREGIPPLVGVQSLRSAEEFDLLLISNAYTLELINLPYLLIRSGIPLFSSQRSPKWPIIILGGSNAMAAQAIIADDGDSLVDGIFFGEGEGLAEDLVRFLQRHSGPETRPQSESPASHRRWDRASSPPISPWKGEPHEDGADPPARLSPPGRESHMNKRVLLEQAARRIPGFWAAGALNPTTKAVLSMPVGQACQSAVQARFLPVEYPLLNSPEVHAASLQINYGCPAFCSFCFEGYDRKPYRELPLPDVLSIARQIKRAQGNEELNVYSFNFNTHQDILEIVLELQRLFDRVSLKSQRLDILQRTPYLLEAEVEADKRNFTLGIEGISERLRAWLHKSISTADIPALLERLLALQIRRIKLFYLLTGYETDEDIEEFRHFLKWLKGTRSRNRRVRIVFSFGLLIRMPFTPLRYDRLLLDEEAWRPLIGQVKSACETNGFEFRLAFDWPTYCVSQVLAMGGYWLVEPIVALAKKGYCFDTALPLAYWDELKGWMEGAGYWNDAFLGEKGPDYAFALEFVESNVSAEFLYRQYQEAQLHLNSRVDGGTGAGMGTRSTVGRENTAMDSGYCLGSQGQPGRCLGCGACPDEEHRRAITHHSIRRPERGPHATSFMAELREVMVRKRKLQPTYFLVYLAPLLAGVEPAFLNAFVLKEILARYPELTDNLLAVRESLFTSRAQAGRFPSVSGETIFALKAWDVEGLEHTLGEETGPLGIGQLPERGTVEIIGPAEGFTPGTFVRLHLDICLPGDLFREPRARLEQYLRDAYLPYSLRREDAGRRRIRYRFDLPHKALKKKILFGGSFEIPESQIKDGDENGGEFLASLDVGPKFDLGAFLRMFGQEVLPRHARVQVSGIRW